MPVLRRMGSPGLLVGVDVLGGAEGTGVGVAVAVAASLAVAALGV
jgi:hypothetical protein